MDIRKWGDCMGVPKKKMGRPTKRPDAETLTFLYSKYTSVQIAEMLDVAPSTVRSWAYHTRKQDERCGVK